AANQPSGSRRADGKAGDETRAAAERAVVTQAVARVRSAAVSSVVASLGAVASHGQAAASWDLRKEVPTKIF
ncbi:Os10g0142700, partial [Oryza sativa Japonica Group]